MNYDLGFLGGGQLARMSIQAAQRFGLRCLSLDPGADTPASQVAESRQGSLSDPEAVADILRSCQAVTLENEFIPAEALHQAVELAGQARIMPGIETLAVIQDKLHQRQAYARHGAPTPRAVEAAQGPADIGYPMVLKARFGGYDGKGTRWARTPEEFEALRPEWEGGGWLAEELVPFRRELAVMVCRSEAETRCFPTVETVQANHVCDLVFPADVDASAAAIAAVEAVGGYGLFGVELFELPDGSFQINEIAPRPHNTGHYTLDWGGPSQFEAHVRLALGLPLPELEGGPQAMANLLAPGPGDWRAGLRAALAAEPNARVHWYGKAELKPGRKVGHINALTPDQALRARAAFWERARATIEP